MTEPNRWRRLIAGQFTLGGMLSIANCFCWACFAAGIRELPNWAVSLTLPLMLVLGLPIGVFFMVPIHTGGPSVGEITFTAIGLGGNSLLWGHGAAWLIRRFGGFGRSSAGPAARER